MAGRPRTAREHTRASRSRTSSRGRAAALSHALDEGRVKVALVLFAAFAVLLVGRLFMLQVVLADEYSAMAEESRTISFDTTARRGTIYDRNGVVLATSVDATTVYCNPAEVTDPTGEAAKIAEVLGGDAKDYRDILSQGSTTFAYVKRQADVEAAQKLEDLELAGIYFIDDTRREYPNGSIGGQVIGMCDVDGNGITGLELQYDDILKGTPGTYSAERGRDGTPIPGGVHEDVPAVDGQDIMVSIDIKLQDSVEQALKAGVESDAIGGEKGSSVVMDAATGEVYAICSLPYMDPSNPSEMEIGSDIVAPIVQPFEPGSIFKTVSALAVLESGTMSPDDTLFCPSAIQADEYVVSDAHDRADETMSLREILDKSSNVGISLASEDMGFSKLYDTIVRLSLNEPTGIDFPGEAGGYLPDYESWSLITSYNISFGQGLSVTPLQMTRFYGALANNGVEVTPHFLISLPQTGERPEYATEQVITDEAALADMKSMLRTVVTEGTGKDAGIDGYEVVGKTSTAEVARDGKYVQGLYNLCFTGFIDNSSSQLVCFVSANEVYSEASVASIFRDIMTDAVEQYNIVPK